jgi:hypothetical protein
MMYWANSVRAMDLPNWLGVAPAELERRHVFVLRVGGASSNLNLSGEPKCQ